MRTTRWDRSKVRPTDLVRRDFEPENIDQLRIGDATYMWADEGI